MAEIEYKFLLQTDIKSFRSLLKKLGYIIDRRAFERTVMYDNDQSLMQTTNGRIRLRKHGSHVSLSYKRPLPTKPGQPKKEIEYESQVSSFGQTARILEQMGYHPSSSYEKYRTKFHRDKFVLTIDEYPHATYIEIEGEPQAITAAAKELCFDLKMHLSKPADTLFNEWRGERNLPEKMHLNFQDYDQ